MTRFDFASLLFVLAALIGVVNERSLRLPRPVALLLGALAASALIIAIDAIFSQSMVRAHLHDRILTARWPKLLLNGVLAALLFAGSLHVDLRALRRRAAPVAVLATIGVIVAAALFAIGIFATLRQIGEPAPLAWCFVLGAILAPTDAVAVEGLLARVTLPAGLREIIGGESLFNDGAAVVLFGAALALVGGDADVLGHGRLAQAMLVETAGGAALGAAAGYGAYRMMRASVDLSLALTISLALVLATYRGALAIDLSGPIAVVCAGLTLAYGLAGAPETDRLRTGLTVFWSQVDGLLNTLLYMLIGFAMLAIDFNWRVLLAMLAAVPLALLARLVSVGGPVLLFYPLAPNLSRAVCVLTWAGLRGGISIALALILPESPWRNLLLTICFGVVIFTVVVQGVTLPAVARRLYGAVAK